MTSLVRLAGWLTTPSLLPYFWPSGFHHTCSFASQDRIVPLRPRPARAELPHRGR